MDDTLAREIAARVVHLWPHVRVDVRGPSALSIDNGAHRIDIRLDNLRARLATCLGDLDREHGKRQFLQIIADGVEPPPHRAEDVIATLRSRELVQFALRGCVSRPFAGDLVIVYGVDRVVSTQFPVQSALAALGLDEPARLHEVALANLAACLPPAEAFEDLQGFPGVYVRDVGEPHESDRLLLTPQWPVIEDALGGAMLASAPARGVLLIAAPAQLDTLFDATQTIAARHLDPLGRAILRWSASGWRVNL